MYDPTVENHYKLHGISSEMRRKMHSDDVSYFTQVQKAVEKLGYKIKFTPRYNDVDIGDGHVSVGMHVSVPQEVVDERGKDVIISELQKLADSVGGFEIFSCAGKEKSTGMIRFRN